MLKHLSFVAISVLACTLMDQSSASKPTEEPEFVKKFSLISTEPLPFKIEGLGDAEGDFRWTNQQTVTFTGPAVVEGLPVKRVVLLGVTALASDAHNQFLDISLNDTPIGNRFVFASGESQDVPIIFTKGLKGDVTIKFSLPNACTASVFDSSNPDPRILGLQLREFEVVTQKPTGSAQGWGSCVLF